MKDIQKGSTRIIKVIQVSVSFLLCILIIVLGSLTYSILRYSEVTAFQSQFNSATLLITMSAQGRIQRKVSAASLVDRLYSTAISPHVESLPNFTLPDFEVTMDVLCTIAGLRYIAFSPLVTNATRLKWESYAAANVNLLHGPLSLNTSIDGSWTVAKGIYNISASTKRSREPTTNIMFPIWQVAPIAANSALVMMDPYSKLSLPFERHSCNAVEKVVKYKQTVFTDFVFLIVDGVNSTRPSTVIYSPIQSKGTGSPMVGLFSGGFSWDDVLKGILPPEYKQIDCVVSTRTATYTFALLSGKVTLSGVGDLHDATFSHYATSISLASIQNFDYKITLYPTEMLYSAYVTDTPRNICIIVVSLIAFTASLVMLYGRLVKKQEKKMSEVAKHSFAERASRNAVLLAKKMYVRYISHEMRTPLNAAYLGLKIIEKDLMKNRGSFYHERVDTVRDVMDACDIAVGFLNDLLNYDKLEDGTLMIEPKSMVALPFIISSVKLFYLQAEEKGVNLVLDIEEDETFFNNSEDCESFTRSPSGWRSSKDDEGKNSSMFLTDHDYISVDEHKMSQVIRNLVSNAIKFTPGGRTVTVKVRRVISKRVPKAAAFQDLAMRIPIQSKGCFPQLVRPISPAVPTTVPGTMPGSGTVSPRLSTPPQKHSFGHNDVESGCLWFASKSRPSQKKIFPNISEHLIDYLSRREKHVEPIEYGMMVMEVIDAGVGMAVEDSMRLFKEVIQFNPSELQAGGGSGLGLVITKALVDMHGGDVSVYSAGKGHGCTFTLSIPFTPAPIDLRSDSSTIRSGSRPFVAEHEQGLHLHQQQMNIPPQVQMQMHWQKETVHPSFRTTAQDVTNDLVTVSAICTAMIVDRKLLHFLVVDDSKLNRRMLCKLLLSNEHTCDEAEDGLEAVRKYTERLHIVGDPSNKVEMYDAVLMDFMMPNMDGPTATKIIRGLGFKGLILGITGNVLPTDVDHFVAHGADQVLFKPVNLEALESAFLPLYA